MIGKYSISDWHTDGWVQRIANGPLAQLVARLHGMEEVTGSNPVRSTTLIAHV